MQKRRRQRKWMEMDEGCRGVGWGGCGGLSSSRVLHLFQSYLLMWRDADYSPWKRREAEHVTAHPQKKGETEERSGKFNPHKLQLQVWRSGERGCWCGSHTCTGYAATAHPWVRNGAPVGLPVCVCARARVRNGVFIWPGPNKSLHRAILFLLSCSHRSSPRQSEATSAPAHTRDARKAPIPCTPLS